GSVYGGSLDYAVAGLTRERRPSGLKKPIGMAMWSAGLAASRQRVARMAPCIATISRFAQLPPSARAKAALRHFKTKCLRSFEVDGPMT
ncbi:hypothetical protein, partial [Bradyrhizobium sp.]|uniref:hypothetical protein n=1 Tax=Bradyrhizobium sp. TaxID=376 RepID=UPI003C78FEE4